MVKKKTSPLAAAVVAILAEHGIAWPGGAENACIRRTYCGWVQKSAGAWTWLLEPVRRGSGMAYPEVGSQWPAKLFASKKATIARSPWGAIDLDPAADVQRRESAKALDNGWRK